MSDTSSWSHDAYTYGCEPIPLAAHMAAVSIPLVSVSLEEEEAGCALCLSLRRLLPVWPCAPSAREQLLSKLK